MFSLLDNYRPKILNLQLCFLLVNELNILEKLKCILVTQQIVESGTRKDAFVATFSCTSKAKQKQKTNTKAKRNKQACVPDITS